MRAPGSYQYPSMDFVVYGKPAAQALSEEAERLNAKRVFLIASRILRDTDAAEDAVDDAVHKRNHAIGI